MATRIKPGPLSGAWVHPADGDDYPVELTMSVIELHQFDTACWTTRTFYPEGSGFEGTVSEWQYVFIPGNHSIIFAVRRPDGSWSNASTMSMERWYVANGTVDAAREVMRDFFTTGGYTPVRSTA